MTLTPLLSTTTFPPIADRARSAGPTTPLAGDFARGQRRSDVELAVVGTFATGQRRLPATAVVGTFATGMLSMPASATMGDFATGMRTVRAPHVTGDDSLEARPAERLAA